ncbi:hypothetical protein [Modicisalibacter coralii]|uniref:hypothetical protein n=1 Tax=Modicisalibacter coralii TaxID=2304602 RepID=UPI00100B0BD1|nr:hypothetical protein [Halomonas coralii]
MSNMHSQEGWKWYGFPGHHICGARCQFHLATSINGKYLVSTVGRLILDPLREPGKIEQVGADRYFETMVFEMDGDNADGDPNILDWGGLEMEGYNHSLDAERGHYEVCRQYAALCENA